MLIGSHYQPFTLYALEGIRTIATPAQVPVIAWVTGSAGAVMMLWGPEEYGGRGDFPARLEEEMKKGSSEIDALNSRAVLGPHDDILQIPGYPIMYDYERNPQKVPEHNRAAHAMFLNIAYQFMKASDGVITVSSPVLEKECVEACDDFFASMGKTHFSIGPLSVIPTPSNKGDAVTEEVLSFLEKAIEEFGEKSVLYISFGTFWWPGEPSIFSAIVDQLIETKTPFILAHPSPVNQPAADLLEKIRGYPHGIDVVWASQEKILSHPATGWFLTHAGWNSIQEAFTYKTPLILWPTGADQPLNASLLSVKYQAAFELLEVRTGEHGRKKPYRCGDGPTPKFTVESAKEEFGRVLKDSKEEQGAAVRKNFEKLAMKVGKVWDEGGDARKGLETFLRKYVD
ncbi:UDP-Glycosyltransferase/glycogen phosphorylase [Marasmius fiardii PR-910]|nr:UDP-Glycosyltransferase/glycogen phosphorylase [Marasmius fiardii PR-910]